MRVKVTDDLWLKREVKQKLRENNGYCPCALVHEPDTHCICKDFRDKIEHGYIGPCNCGLYINYEETAD